MVLLRLGGLIPIPALCTSAPRRKDSGNGNDTLEPLMRRRGKGTGFSQSSGTGSFWQVSTRGFANGPGSGLAWDPAAPSRLSGCPKGFGRAGDYRERRVRTPDRVSPSLLSTSGMVLRQSSDRTPKSFDLRRSRAVLTQGSAMGDLRVEQTFPSLRKLKAEARDAEDGGVGTGAKGA